MEPNWKIEAYITETACKIFQHAIDTNNMVLVAPLLQEILNQRKQAD
ncbi:MAG: hypothetical protein JHC33_11005 [Ignisphaera sp.]|jgi:hypothetical protein|nr:hypothetical protein [Ignisphaera sp.]